MFQKITLNAFLQKFKDGQTSLLFIKEQGCRYCEIAEAEMKSDEFIKAINSVKVFEASIDDEPGLPSQLGLVGVPAFLKVDGSGRKIIKTGFENIESLTEFILAKET